eukprot:13266015-Ditylum_brightwellii.AAC.1
MEIPNGFYYKDSDSTNKLALHLKRNLYGLKQASYNWSKLLKGGLQAQGYTQSKVETGLYIKDNLPSDDVIYREISSLTSAGFDLTDKGD